MVGKDERARQSHAIISPNLISVTSYVDGSVGDDCKKVPVIIKFAWDASVIFI